MTTLKLAVKLVAAQAGIHPARAVLSSLAIVASSCAVVWTVSSYDALISHFDESANEFLGRYDLLIFPIGDSLASVGTLRPELIASLRRDVGVLEVNPLVQSRASITAAEKKVRDDSALSLLVGDRPPVSGAPPVDPMVVGTDASEEPYELLKGDWLSSPTQNEAVMSQGAAEQLAIDVGDEIDVTTIANRVRLKVIGIVKQAFQEPTFDSPPPSQSENQASSEQTLGPNSPNSGGASDGQAGRGISIPMGMINAPAVSAVYVRVSMAARINGQAARPNLLQVVLRDGVAPARFHEAWDATLAQESPPLSAVDFAAVRSGMEKSDSVIGKRAQAYSATGLASLAAIFIIFTALSMGVSERAREFALLRAIALTRGQIAAIIVVEGLSLAMIGWIGGLLAGWGTLYLAAKSTPELFSETAQLGWACIALTGATVLIAALAAAIVPAWQAMRIRPLDVMARTSAPNKRNWPVVCLIVGIAFIAIAPLSVFILPIEESARPTVYTTVSYPSLLIGMALIAPAAVICCETCLSPMVARLLGLDSHLLCSQLTTNLLRTVGATLSLASGLALFASTQIWGYSMLQFYIPGEWLPDVLVAFHPIGLTEDEVSQIETVNGVKPGEVLPLMVEQAKFAWSEQQMPSGLRQDNAVIIGFDALRAIGGDDPFLNLDFVHGDRKTVAAQIAEMRSCIVSEDFVTLTGLSVGDTLRFSPPNDSGKVVEYQIGAVVSLPGWQWITKFSGLRRHFVRTMRIVFADAAHVRDDFKLDRNEFFWLNRDEAVPLHEIEASFQDIATRKSGATFAHDSDHEVVAYRPFARVTAAETVRRAISMVGDEVIWGMSKLPLICLMITSLAVANVVIASVRARKWQMGILRAIGITQSQITRLVIAEAIMIGLSACILSLGFGLMAGWCGVGMSRYSGTFYSPPTMYIPWLQLTFGFVLALALCLIAAIWPALTIVRTSPLALLQSGRTAM